MSSFSPLAQTLINEFHPPLSPSLIATLSFDHDPEDESSLPRVRESLRMLANETITDEELDLHRLARQFDDWSLDSTLSEAGTGSAGWMEDPNGSSSIATSVSDQDEPVTPLDFLKRWFPYSSVSYLEEALADNPSGDLSQVLESLLSLEAIREAEEKGSWGEGEDGREIPSSWESKTQEERDELWMVGTSRPSTPTFASTFERDFNVVAAKKKKKKKPTTTTTTTILSPLPSSPSQTKRLPQSKRQTSSSVPAKAILPTNRWNDLTSVGASMASLSLCSPKATASFFISYLHDPSYPSPRSALLAALSFLVVEGEPVGYIGIEFLVDILFASDDFSKNLEDAMRERGNVDLVWQACLGNFSEALEMWTILDRCQNPSSIDVPFSSLKVALVAPSTVVAGTTSLSKASSRSPKGAFPNTTSLSNRTTTTRTTVIPPEPRSPPKDSFPLPSPIRPGTKARAQKIKVTSASVAAAPTKDTHPLSLYIPAYKTLGERKKVSGGDYEALRMRELDALQRRKEALTQASKLFSTGGSANRGGEVAAHYAEQARKYHEASRQFSLDAARAKLERSVSSSPSVLDLHGLTAYQALEIVHERVQAWWRSGDRTSSNFVIITGRGSHSKGGRSVLRPAVAKSLQSDGWHISLGREGMIVVTGVA